jgi:hypothetical protein
MMYLPSLTCRSMDPVATMHSKYQYHPCEVEFSCKSTPLPLRLTPSPPMAAVKGTSVDLLGFGVFAVDSESRRRCSCRRPRAPSP